MKLVEKLQVAENTKREVEEKNMEDAERIRKKKEEERALCEERARKEEERIKEDEERRNREGLHKAQTMKKKKE